MADRVFVLYDKYDVPIRLFRPNNDVPSRKSMNTYGATSYRLLDDMSRTEQERVQNRIMSHRDSGLEGPLTERGKNTPFYGAWEK